MNPSLFIRCTASAALVLAALAIAPAQAQTHRIEVETSPLAGQSGWLAFQLVAGSPTATSMVMVSDFTGAAPLGEVLSAGDVSGSLTAPPLTLAATTFFSEYLQAIDFVAGAMQFTLDLTPSFTAGSIPDGFSFYLLDADFVPYETDDPTGANALLAVDLDDVAALQIFHSEAASVSLVPEPPTLALWMLSLALLAGRGRLAKRFAA
jgi:hypothetical protein